MDFLKKSFRGVFVVIFALICTISLLSSCQFALPPGASKSTTPSQDTTVSPTHATYRSSAYVEVMRETKDPADYDVLRDAKKYLQYDAETGTLNVYVWRIDSFDFLSEFENVRKLIVNECYITEGVTIPRTDTLEDIVEIQMGCIYGSGAADVLAECLPLPQLDILSLSGGIPNKSPLPTIPSLTDLYVSVPDTLDIISNNTQITGALCFGDPFVSVHDDIKKIDGIEKFSSIQYLSLPPSVHDISPLAGCASLRILDASSNDRIDSLKPLYGLANLEEINLRENAYNAVPEDEREHFTPNNNRDAVAVHVYIPGVTDYMSNENEQLSLSDQKIESFDFLSEYPNLKYLSVVNCDIDDGLVLPKIDTLTRLTLIDPNVLKLIKNNIQLAGQLDIGTWVALNVEDLGKEPPPLINLSGLEAFTSLENLNVGVAVADISALSGCRNLRSLSLLYCSSINTLKPLYELSRLRMLIIGPTAFNALPQEDQDRFSDKHKPYMTDLEWR